MIAIVSQVDFEHAQFEESRQRYHFVTKSQSCVLGSSDGLGQSGVGPGQGSGIWIFHGGVGDGGWWAGWAGRHVVGVFLSQVPVTVLDLAMFVGTDEEVMADPAFADLAALAKSMRAGRRKRQGAAAARGPGRAREVDRRGIEEPPAEPVFADIVGIIGPLGEVDAAREGDDIDDSDEAKEESDYVGEEDNAKQDGEGGEDGGEEESELCDEEGGEAGFVEEIKRDHEELLEVDFASQIEAAAAEDLPPLPPPAAPPPPPAIPAIPPPPVPQGLAPLPAWQEKGRGNIVV